MPKFENGVQTQIMQNHIYCKDQDQLLTEEEMLELDIQHLFENGIIDRIITLGYPGSRNDIPSIVNFIVKQCKKYEIDLSRPTIKNWFDEINQALPPAKDKKGPPNDSSQSRPNVYKLCFALEMNALEVEEFFLKKYLCRPFNYKNADEAVFYFCFNTNRSYQTAVNLLSQVNAINGSEHTLSKETQLIGIELSKIETEKDFLIYMTFNKYSGEEIYHTIKAKIFGLYDKNDNLIEKGLLKKCEENAVKEKKLRRITVGQNNALKSVISPDDLFTVMYGFDKRKFDQDKIGGIATKSKFSKFIKRNFPHIFHFSQIRGMTATSDIYKKTLMLLCFYEFYSKLTIAEIKRHKEKKDASNQSMYSLDRKEREKKEKEEKQETYIDLYDYADEFERRLDELLNECGFDQIYYRNPFDWFIMHCVYSSNPLYTFRKYIQQYYLDVIGESSLYELP